MEAGVSGGGPLPRLRRPLRPGAEPRDPLLPQQPFGSGGTAEESTAVEKKKQPLARLNIHSAFWILASIAVTYYFDFFKTVKETIQADSFNVALWPVWSFMTPLLLFIQFMGVVMLVSLLG
ncbi:transmembrane protein 128 isoform X2 [Strigops habroptila]|uniref:transmembrane protein 128 isoform X2 n=1 Tax=Strigops habroptila TaxID=2489341 RepID=UPI0014035ECB|nr:transmembrane protein 128 isoform X2 [Strigops habroptila]